MRSAPTRRGLLATGGMAAAALAASAAPALAAEPDPHAAWLARIVECRRLQNTPGLLPDGEAQDAVFQEQIELEDLLYETPARTLDGVRAQLAALATAAKELTFGEHEEGCLEVALASVDRLLGSAVDV